MGKIYYYLKKDLNTFEGKDKISGEVYNYLKKYYSNLEIFDEFSISYGDDDIIHINSSGILDSIKYGKMNKNLKIYSLYSNLKANPITLLRDSIDFFKLKDKNLKISLFYLFKRRSFPIFLSLIPWFLIKKILGQNEVLILPNKYLYKNLNIKTAKIIPIGIDAVKFHKKNIEKNSKITVAYAGHPAVDKGIIEVLKIFSRLDSTKFRKVLFLTNLNINLDYLKKIDPSVEIFGPQKDIVDTYNSIDILILPYRHEISSIASPLVLIEAMACEVPVITSDLPHVKEIGGEILQYVKPFDISDFVKKVSDLANNPEKRLEMGKKSRNIVLEYYDEKETLMKYMKIYDTVIKRDQNE
ncbi:glycosyltransferase family 4 protein [Methanococcus maripaludis]|uniref:Glycosyl transferases group 1 n=1 Tax=Methanococcus maripaludis TaxID=39152 RepID=A0A2L1CCS7_METMI|nr:glycosyltransferase family 4 protein [Methanococcus maripaludis]AVB77129.1 Glycosyl transferases group 1 [Methanococcus maripaludis]MBA2863641.1 glycosyltransferase involved in cell wall biosynthesis [Methanococcus maripaludis]MBB6496353.1 glycosyltransferase involved in cell wall biosynthesis [Methanococcus maripaludis]